MINPRSTTNIPHGENIIARRYFYPGNHKMEPYCRIYPGVDHSLPVTNNVCDRVMHLPGGASMTEENIQAICNILKLVISNAEECQQRLSIMEVTN